MKAFEPGPPDVPMQRLAPADLAFEFMLNALRLTDGFTQAAFVRRTGLSWDAVRFGVVRAESLGLLSVEGAEAEGRVVPTGRGRRFLNDLQALFLPDADLPGRPVPAGAGRPVPAAGGIG
jgi:coproporphyrinogen III oxidase-like Fe-S oxidoreductase